jgi:NAD(P)-dependent dehydrogenase (short-subunit alcohol dehydrogenase family)
VAVVGKVALVTGAGQGIGRAIAVQMAREGAAAVSVIDRQPQTLAETADLITAEGAQAAPIVCDLREGDQIAAMIEETVARFGSLDVLVNNAGLIETSLSADTAIDELPEEA